MLHRDIFSHLSPSVMLLYLKRHSVAQPFFSFSAADGHQIFDTENRTILKPKRSQPEAV